MIVLDEQLLGRQLDEANGRWYPGRAMFVTDVRPGTVIKDDVIPELLCRQRLSAFVTINVADFWLKISPAALYSVVCAALKGERADEVDGLLRRLLRLPSYKARAGRMGHVFRLTRTADSFYSVDLLTPQAVIGW